MPGLSFDVIGDQKQVLFRKVSELIEEFQIKSLLDIGAGDSTLALPLSKKVKKYVGIEKSPDRATKLREAGLKVIEGEFPNIDIANKFDLVLSSHSIPEHIDQYEPFLKKAWGLVKNNGWLVIITFKGADNNLEELTNQLRQDWIDDDEPKFKEMMSILPTFGEIATERIVSHSSSSDIEPMTDLLTSSVGGSKKEKQLYRPRLKEVLKEEYRAKDKFIFPHEHIVLKIQKSNQYTDSAQKTL